MRLRRYTPRPQRARRASTPSATPVAVSALQASDPRLASEVTTGLVECVARDTRSSYGTGVRDWLRFCAERGLEPWPPDTISFCGWLHATAKRIKVASIDMYKAGVRTECILRGLGWPLEADLIVAKTLQYLRQKYPADPKGRKVPVTVGVLKVILPLLPGWPDMATMSAEDRAFAAASVIGVNGFLRGCEFLAPEKRRASTRQLLQADVQVRPVNGHDAVCIKLRSTKAKKHLKYETAACFGHVDDDTFCPVRLWRAYLTRCGCRSLLAPAFVLNGAPLSRNFMVSKTTALMVRAGFSFLDCQGEEMDMKASSWRAGGASSAMLAGIPVADIKALGRWSSLAWESYVMLLPPSLEGSSRSIWSLAPLVPGTSSSGSRVGEFVGSGVFVAAQAAQLLG